VRKRDILDWMQEGRAKPIPVRRHKPNDGG